MRYIFFNLLSIVIFTLSGSAPFSVHSEQIEFDTVKGIPETDYNPIGKEGLFDFNLPEGFSIPNDEIDEETAISIMKFGFLNSPIWDLIAQHNNGFSITWDELQVILYTCNYDYGKEKAYVGCVYFGTEETYTKEILNDKLWGLYETRKEIAEYRAKGEEPPQSLIEKRDNVFSEPGFDTPFYNTSFPANINKPIGSGGGGGPPYMLNFQYQDLEFVKKETGDDNAKIVGYMSNGWWSCAIYEANGKEYYVTGRNYGLKVIEKSVLDEKSSEGTGHTPEQIEKMRERVLKAIYLVQTDPRIKAGTYKGDRKYYIDRYNSKNE